MGSTLLLLLCVLAAAQNAGDTPSPPAPPSAARAVFLRGLDRMEAAQKKDFMEELGRFVADELRRTGSDTDLARLRASRREVLLGLASLFDATGALETNLVTRNVFSGIRVGPEEERRRALIGGWVRFHGRNDAVRHFFLSAALCTLAGPAIAEQIGRQKEIEDAREFGKDSFGQGFSFHDLAYDHAGIRFACWLLGWNNDERLQRPAPPIAAFIPSFADMALPENMDWPTFAERFYGDNWKAYREVIEKIHRRLDDTLAPHEKESSPPPEPR